MAAANWIGRRMKSLLVYAKFSAGLIAFLGYLVFALHLNEKLKPVLSDLERATLIILSIAGAALLIAKANEYVSARFLRTAR